jgi:hypothetical protein
MLPKKGGRDLSVLSQFWLAARVGAWLSVLPIVLRTRTLPLVLERLAVASERPRTGNPLDLNQTVQIVVRVCRLRIFRLPVFPRPCLRRSLALYYFLGRMGHPIEIHFGVRKDGRDLHGHSWVTLQGKALRERDPAEAFSTIYSYGSGSYRSALREAVEPQAT